MYEYIRNTIKNVAHEPLSVKVKKNYRTNWMITEVLECINLKRKKHLING
jgi:hypothetical protein